MKRLAKVFSDTFDDTISLTRDLGPVSLESWDSFNHINLMLAVEQEYQVTFTTEEIQNIPSVGDLVDLLNLKNPGSVIE